MSSSNWNPAKSIPSKAQWKAFKKEKGIKSGISSVKMGDAFKHFQVVKPTVTPFCSRKKENRRVLIEKLDTYMRDFESKYGDKGGRDMGDVYDSLQKVKDHIRNLHNQGSPP